MSQAPPDSEFSLARTLKIAAVLFGLVLLAIAVFAVLAGSNLLPFAYEAFE